MKNIHSQPKSLLSPFCLALYLVGLLFLVTPADSKLGFTSIIGPTSDKLKCLSNLKVANVSMMMNYASNSTTLNAIASSLTTIKANNLVPVLGINFQLGYDVQDKLIHIISTFPHEKYEMLWLMPYQVKYIDSNPFHQIQKTSLKTSKHHVSQNCQQIKLIANLFKMAGLDYKLSIAVSLNVWNSVYGEDCVQLSKYPLFWIPPQFDQQQSYDGFQPFGGWTKPSAKLHRNIENICNGLLGFLYYFQ